MTTAAEIFRDYATDGVPASGANKPVKSDIRTWGLGLESGIKGVHAADIPSATTLNLTAAAGELVDVTGTTTVAAITLPDGNEATVRFTGALTLTNGASLVLPGAADILTVAGDFAIFRGYAAGVVRCILYGRGDGKALIAPSAGTLVGAGQILNATITESHSANAVTFALKTLAGADPSASDPVKAYFRNATAATGNYVERTITAALSVTIPSTATMGFTSGAAGKIWLVLVDDGGTLRLGAVNCLNGTSIYPLGQFPIISSTTIGTGSDSAAVIYTNTGAASKPYLVLGYASYEGANVIATAGTWANSPLRIQLQGPSDPLPGNLIQLASNTDGAVATGTTTVPYDDTIPQITEGTQFMTQAITPTSAANLLQVEALLMLAPGTNGVSVTAALFQDATAGALAVSHDPSGVQEPFPVAISHMMLAGTISSTTFRARAGGNSATTTNFNGSGAARKFGGVMGSRMTVREMMA